MHTAWAASTLAASSKASGLPTCRSSRVQSPDLCRKELIQEYTVPSMPTAIVRPLSLAKFSFVISNIRFPPAKRAPWQDAGMPASDHACQSPLNKIVLILRRLRSYL